MHKSTQVLFTLFLFGLSTVAAGQGGSQGQPRTYDPATEGTWTGVVEAVNVVPGSGRGGGLHLTLKTAAERLDVHVGPTWFVSSKGVTFAKGDNVTVTGSKVTVSGAPAVIAREIKKGDTTLTLRNASGIPAWSGRGRTGQNFTDPPARLQ